MSKYFKRECNKYEGYQDLYWVVWRLNYFYGQDWWLWDGYNRAKIF